MPSVKRTYAQKCDEKFERENMLNMRIIYTKMRKFYNEYLFVLTYGFLFLNMRIY